LHLPEIVKEIARQFLEKGENVVIVAKNNFINGTIIKVDDGMAAGYNLN
jgi:hypothetical protein